MHLSKEAQPTGMKRTVQLKKEPRVSAVLLGDAVSCAGEGSLLTRVSPSRNVKPVFSPALSKLQAVVGTCDTIQFYTEEQTKNLRVIPAG